MGMVWGNYLDPEGVVEVHCKLVVLLYNMVDRGDRFVDKEVEGEIEIFVGSVDMGGCCEVAPQVSPKGCLQFLDMVDLLQGVCLLDWEFPPN